MSVEFRTEHDAAEWFRVGLATYVATTGLDALRAFPDFTINPTLGVLASLHRSHDESPTPQRLAFRKGLRLAFESGLGTDEPPAVRRYILKLAKRYKPSGLNDVVEHFWRTGGHRYLATEERAAQTSAVVDYLCTYEADARLLAFFAELKASPDWRPSYAVSMLVFALSAAGAAWIGRLRELKEDFDEIKRTSEIFELQPLLSEFCRTAPLRDIRDGIKTASIPEGRGSLKASSMNDDRWLLDELFDGADAPLAFKKSEFGGELGIDVLAVDRGTEDEVVEMNAGECDLNWQEQIERPWDAVWRRYYRGAVNSAAIVRNAPADDKFAAECAELNKGVAEFQQTAQKTAQLFNIADRPARPK